MFLPEIMALKGFDYFTQPDLIVGIEFHYKYLDLFLYAAAGLPGSLAGPLLLYLSSFRQCKVLL